MAVSRQDNHFPIFHQIYLNFYFCKQTTVQQNLKYLAFSYLFVGFPQYNMVENPEGKYISPWETERNAMKYMLWFKCLINTRETLIQNQFIPHYDTVTSVILTHYSSVMGK